MTDTVDEPKFPVAMSSSVSLLKSSISMLRGEIRYVVTSVSEKVWRGWKISAPVPVPLP